MEVSSILRHKFCLPPLLMEIKVFGFKGDLDFWLWSLGLLFSFRFLLI